MIELPVTVRRKAAGLGDEGARWVRSLPGLVDELQREWAFSVVGAPFDGGTAAYVVRVRTVDGRDAVLKIALPDHGNGEQVRTIASAQGHGYVRLLAYDVERLAMLQEALGPSLAELGLSPETTIRTLCATLEQAWQVSRDPAVVVPHDKAEGLGAMIQRVWIERGQPVPERVVRKALRYAERRAAASALDRCVVVHGDPHPANALRVPEPRAGAESGFVFVDPDGFLADPTYDLGVVLRDWCAQLLAADDPVVLARTYCRLLADVSGHDETAIWEWGYLERVSTGLYCLDFGLDALARPFLATADLLATG